MLKTKDGYAKVIGTSYEGSSDYLLLSNGNQLGISTLVRAGVYDKKDLNELDTYSFVKSVYSSNKDTSPKGTTGWYNIIQAVHRNGLADGPGYIGQLALGMTSNINDMFFRTKYQNTWNSWKTVVHSGNIADQSVKYATSSGNADTLDKLHASAFLQLKNNRFTQYNKGTWTKILKFTTPASTIQASISFTWHPSECARNVWADFSINIRGGITFFVSWKGEERRTLMCVGTDGEYAVWVKGDKARWDPYGVIQVTQTWDIASYETGSLAYSDDTPTGTYSAEASMRGYVLQADRLITSRNINGTAFNGTKDITTSYWGTARNITIGKSIKSVNGSANVAWSLADIGAASDDHTHPYLPLAGGEMNNGAQITRKAKDVSWVQGRDSALIKDTTSSGYHALWSLKTKEGSWEFGEFQNDINTDNVPVLTYITDTNYTNKNNTATYQQKFQLASGTIALTSQIPSSLPANGGNADTVDGYHAGGLFTAFGNENHNITATIGGVTKKFQVNYASDSDKLDGKHASDFAAASHRHAWSEIDNKPATATRWPSWAEVTDRPTIPTVGNGTITISQTNNTNQTFTVNQAGDKTITLKDTWRPISDNYEAGDSNTSLSTLGSLTLYNDLLSAIPTIPTIPNPTNYYWANNKVSNKSTTDAIVQVNSIGAGCSTVFGSQQNGTVAATNWFRAVGKTGIYFQTYTGGLYMTDTSWIRTFNNKGLCIKNTVKSNDLQVMYKDDETVATSAAVLESATTLVYGTSTSSNSINTYMRGQNITLQVKNGTTINYNAFQVTADETRCFNYFNMKNGAEVSAGKFLAKATTSLSYSSSYINYSLVVSNSSINIATVNKVQYKEESISFQFGNGSYASDVGTATIFIPYGYTVKNIRWNPTISSGQTVKKVELINVDTLSATLKATLLIGSIAGPANIDIYYYLYPDTVIKNLYNTNIPQLYLANNIAQIQYKDKFLSLTDSGLYINGTVYQQLNGYHKQPVFIASAIYNGTRWEYRGCEHISVGIQCTTMIPNCSINNYLVIPVNVTITEVYFLANQCRIRFNDSSAKYRGIYVYYIGD